MDRVPDCSLNYWIYQTVNAEVKEELCNLGYIRIFDLGSYRTSLVDSRARLSMDYIAEL